MISPRHELDAEKTALQLLESLRIGPGANMPAMGFILGNGWEQALSFDEPPKSVLLKNLHGFHEPRKTTRGEDPRVVYGRVHGVPVIAQIGSIRLSDPPADRSIQDMVRLQVEMLIQAGVKRFVLASSADGTDDIFSADNATHETREIQTGDVVLISGFLSVLALNLPGFSGERGSPDRTIDWTMFQQVEAYAAENSAFWKRLHTGGYAMINNPYDVGRYDRSFLGTARLGIKAVGTGLLPEACVASLYRKSRGVSLLPLALMTNEAERDDATETREIAETKKLLPGLFRSLVRKSISNGSR